MPVFNILMDIVMPVVEQCNQTVIAVVQTIAKLIGA